jgi:hypothetical protein
MFRKGIVLYRIGLEASNAIILPFLLILDLRIPNNTAVAFSQGFYNVP